MSARLVETLPLSRGGDTGNVKLWIAAPTQTQVTPSLPDPDPQHSHSLSRIPHPRTWRATHLSDLVTGL
ncbi:hypothetical protein BDZ89DRAFT_1074433, partial [Hymenopellis radicata]